MSCFGPLRDFQSVGSKQLAERALIFAITFGKSHQALLKIRNEGLGFPRAAAAIQSQERQDAPERNAGGNDQIEDDPRAGHAGAGKRQGVGDEHEDNRGNEGG